MKSATNLFLLLLPYLQTSLCKLFIPFVLNSSCKSYTKFAQLPLCLVVLDFIILGLLHLLYHLCWNIISSIPVLNSLFSFAVYSDLLAVLISSMDLSTLHMAQNGSPVHIPIPNLLFSITSCRHVHCDPDLDFHPCIC